MLNNLEINTEHEILGDSICDKLDDLKCHCEIVDVSIGPQVIKYSLVPAQGVLARNIPKLRPELMLETGAESMRILAPMPGTKTISVEIPNPARFTVPLNIFSKPCNSPLEFPLGLTPDGQQIYCNLPQQPHMLVSGVTGSGKTASLHSMICSLISRYGPDDLQIALIDPKQVEFNIYEDIPHLATKIVTDAYDAISVFDGIVNCMEKRYTIASEVGAKNLIELNDKQDEIFPHILVVCDEIADLMMTAKRDIEDYIIRIAQKARAVGIHLVLATQSPRKDVITGVLKCNLPTRLAFATSSALDSRIILDAGGAEQLLGNGDCLYSSQGRPAIRAQSPYINNKEIKDLVENIKNQYLQVVS